MTSPPGIKGYGLKSKCLSFPETLSQSVANISPTLTPVVIVPLVFASAGSGTWLSYLFATIGLILVGMNINQFARRSASPGSLYSYIGRGLGAPAGFLAGWCLLVAYLFTAMSVLAGAVNYASILLDMAGIHLWPSVLFAVGVLVAWYVAYRDVKLSTKLMLVLEGLSMLLILVLGAIVVMHHGTAYDPAQFNVAAMDFSGVKAGLILAIFSYVGYESATTLGEEARNPLKNIPRAVILSAAISGIFFMVTSYVAVLGFRGLKTPLGSSAAPFNDLAESVGVAWFGVLISAGAVISLFACTLASINAASRILFAMGRHGIFHTHLSKAHSTNQTPHFAATLASVLVLAVPVVLLGAHLAVLDIFNDLSTIATFGFLVVYVLISIAAPVYLKHLGKLTLGSVALSVVSVLFMIPPIVATVYPMPTPPADKFPYYFIAYVVIGMVWFTVLRKSSRQSVIDEIKADLEFSTVSLGEQVQ